MGHKKYFIDLVGMADARIRVSIRTELGHVIDLVIQLEIWVNAKWLAVARYDCAHGSPHIDLIHRDGEKKKIFLSQKSLKGIVNKAIDDFKNNWEIYLRRTGHVEEK